MNFRMEHVGLAARDTEALKEWYVRVLGAEILFADGKNPQAFFLQLPGGVLVEVYAAKTHLQETSDNSLAGWRHIALQVNSIDEVRQILVSRQVEILEPEKPAGGGGRILFFKDAEGNLLHLVERPQGSVFVPAK